MKTYSPGLFAFGVSLVVSAICVSLVLIANYVPVKSPVLLIAGLFSVNMVVSFLLIYSAVNRFVYDRINPVYKAIGNMPVTRIDLRRKLNSKDFTLEIDNMIKEYSRNRAKEIKKLKKMENYRKEFLGNVSHELKTPIFNIQGYILTLLDGGLEDPEVNRVYLKRTEKSINRMISIIEDLESITKLETGELQLNKEDFDIVRLINEVFLLQDINRKNYNVNLLFAKNYSSPVMVNGDRLRISEALNNLVMNSVIYGNKNGSTTVSLEEKGGIVLVAVSDDGIGIDEKDIPRIFERFYRTDKSRSRAMGGTGLGLAIVKHIIEAHKQTIYVSSKPGVGSVFSFTLNKAQ